ATTQRPARQPTPTPGGRRRKEVMSRPTLCRRAVCTALILTVALVWTRPTRADGDWGTVTGQVVYGAQPYPDNGPAKVDKDQVPCLAKGPILKNDWVINKKNGGLRWALVWLTEANNPKSTKALPLNPALKIMPKEVEIDQPCCVFEPRVLGLR